MSTANWLWQPERHKLMTDTDRSPHPHLHITTPQRTPTSARSADDLFRTAKIDRETPDSSTWTAAFAEEYTLVNGTSGRFTDIPGTFSPQPKPATGHKRQHSSKETLRAGSLNPRTKGRTSISADNFKDTCSLSPTTLRAPACKEGFEGLSQSTRTKAAKDARSFTSQTATPPNSRNKHARRNPTTHVKSKMQNDQEFFSQSGNMDGGYDLSFATPTNVDLFSFPMSDPTTAPAYMNEKSFWDPSNGKTDMMDMTMDFSGDPFGTNVVDWTGDFLPQHQANTPVMHQSNAQPNRRQRPLLAKPPPTSMPPLQSGITFDFGMAALGEDPFTMPSPASAINPNSLFSFSSMLPAMASNATFNTSAVEANSHIEIQPQPTLLSPLAIPRSRSAQSRRPDSSHMRRPISPVKSSRPGVSRTTSDNLNRPPALKPAASFNNDAQPPSNFAGKGRYSSGTGNAAAGGRLSPTKQDSRTDLQAIPEKEKLFNPRTAVTFSIDANGRARTETVILEPGQNARPRSSKSRPSTQGASPGTETSTDEEVIAVPSRNPSCTQKDKNRQLNMPKMARFDTSIKHYSRPRTGERKLSAGNVKALSRAALALKDESDDEVIDTARRSPGDASKALRRVMENRRRSVSGITSMPPLNNTQTIRIQSTSYVAGSHRDRERHYRRQSYVSSINTACSASTPSTVTDLDDDVEMCNTPSSAASLAASGGESTRCVCARREREGDEFMIQWYVLYLHFILISPFNLTFVSPEFHVTTMEFSNANPHLSESCEHWQHSTCVKIDPRELPKVYICAFCAQTPNMRGGGGRRRDKQRQKPETVLLDKDSPLRAKSTSRRWA